MPNAPAYITVGGAVGIVPYRKPNILQSSSISSPPTLKDLHSPCIINGKITLQG